MRRSPQSQFAPDRSTEIPSERPKVLIVDERPVNIELLEALLASEGYRIASTTRGRDALTKVDTERPSLVLLGTRLPDMDGLEVCYRIKNAPSTRCIPVLMMTGVRNVEDRAKGIEAGADDFLSKPVERHELLARVKSLLSIRDLQDTVEERSRQLKDLSTQLQELREQRMRPRPGTESVCRSGPGLPRSRPGTLSSPPRDQTQSTARPAAAQPAPVTSASDETNREALRDLKAYFLSSIPKDTLEELMDAPRSSETAALLSDKLTSVYDAANCDLSDAMREQLFRELHDDILGYGPIEPLLADPTVTEIMVNNPRAVYVERNGRITKTDIQFDDDDHILHVVHRIIRPLGRRIDRYSPMVDARLPDGSRVNAIIAPCAIDAPCITIRKFGEDKLTVEDLVQLGSITAEMADFLEACVHARLNMVVSGGTGTGKTTLLNVLSSFIPPEDRIVTIEDSAELQLHQEHVVRLEANPPDREGRGEVTIRDLVRNSLRMRPERIVVGEVRGAEALDMLQAMNTGHDGSLTTVHANSPRDTLARLETLVLMAGLDLPVSVVRRQIASAINVIIQQARLRDGSRKVTSITEIQGMEGDTVVLSEIFAFHELGMQDDIVIGELEPTGVRPKFTPRLRTAGFILPAEMFTPGASTASGRRRSR